MKFVIIALMAVFLCGCQDKDWSGTKLTEVEVTAQYGDLIGRMSDMVKGGFSNRDQRVALERKLRDTPRPQGIIEASYMFPAGGWNSIWSDDITRKLVYAQSWGTNLTISPVRVWQGNSQDGPYRDALRIRRSITVDGADWVIELIIETKNSDFHD